jgi:diguanylate cyclase (GGDEF)-like protein/PAS domain S-box-containing protein
MPLAYALALAIVLIMAMTWGVLQVQVTLAGFLNSESVWSKAQKQSVIDLGNYALDGDAANLASFQRHFGLLESDRRGRDAIVAGHVDDKEVDQAFTRGTVMPAAKPGMIFLMRYFSGAPHLRDAMAAWRSTDTSVDELGDIADELQRAYAGARPAAAEVARQRARIDALNVYMQPRTNLFSVEVVKGAIWAGQMLFWGVLGAFALAALAWLRMARRILENIRGSEERYRLLFDSADDAIVMVDADSGRILDANRTAAHWTGRSPQDLLGRDFTGLFIQDLSAQDGDTPVNALFNAAGEIKPVETRSSVARWGSRTVSQAIIRDISERVAMEQERRVASRALGSIAEGVIIADAARQVISVNAAHVEITGFTLQALHGMRLDETRSMPDDSVLPDTIWQAIAHGGYWRGEVRSRRRDGSSYPELLSISGIRDGQGHIQHYVAVFTDISSSKADRRRLEHMASHDPLTGLANRAEFVRRCTAAIGQAAIDKSCVAVLFVDLDAFKIVNDSYSHAIGDSLLVEVATRIRRELGRHDDAGRIGGDEFTLLSAGLRSREDATDLARRLLAALSEPVAVGDHEITVSASIGIAGYPLDGEDTSTLIANADSAMYAAKTEERNALRFYTPIMQADARKRLQLAADLRHALLRDELRLMFQPSLDLRSGRIVAVEVLLRWQHPTRGLVMPGDFIPMAESLGLIRGIDEWVIRAACVQIKAWEKAGMPSIRVAINVSASWFGHPAFVAGLRATLAAEQVAPERLLLEITESAMLRLGEGTERTMKALHTLGIDVAIDDFGTGYSSLSYLKLPAVACLKIDRSFIIGLPDHPNDVAIVEAMLAMSRSLGLYTIAEGIENEAQHEFLVRSGCEEAQGYLYARPLADADLQQLLQNTSHIAPIRLQLVPPGRG